MTAKCKMLFALVLLSMAAAPLQARAQSVREPVGHDQVISGNPLALLAGWFNAEYEKKLSETTTAGIAAGWSKFGNDDYTNVSGFFRYYPQGAALTGFYLGGEAGIYNVEAGDDSNTTFGLGVDIGYAWLLGPGRSFYVGLGIGAVRLFSDNLGGASGTVPTARLVNIGIAF